MDSFTQINKLIPEFAGKLKDITNDVISKNKDLEKEGSEMDEVLAYWNECKSFSYLTIQKR